MSIYPTLADLCGLPIPKHVEGPSLKPLLANPSAAWPHVALTTWGFQNHAVRTDRWRYIRYADDSEELYDLQVDPNEWKNLAGDQKLQAVKTELARWLPKIDRPAVPGSTQRILQYDKQTGVAIWEGEKIDPSRLER